MTESTPRPGSLRKPGEDQILPALHPGGMKFDNGKAPVHQGLFKYFARALIAVAHISGYGFEKYKSWGGWREVEVARYEDAKGRHLLFPEIKELGLYDEESRYLHAAHEAWNALAKLDKLLESGVPLRLPISHG